MTATRSVREPSKHLLLSIKSAVGVGTRDCKIWGMELQ